MQIKLACFITILLISNVITGQDQESPPLPFELPPEIEIEKERFEKRTLEQAMQVNNSNQTCKCLQQILKIKRFIICMDYTDKEEVRETFTQMSLYARIRYLEEMDLLQYRRFLSAFETEEQWRETLYSLPEHEQKQLPYTIKEQLEMIRDTWAEASDKKFGHYTQHERDPEAKDLAAWRNRTLYKYEKQAPMSYEFYYWLYIRFLEKKNKLFAQCKKQ